MTIHEIKTDEAVVVRVEELGHVNVYALEDLALEIEVGESFEIKNDEDRGYFDAHREIHAILERYVVDGSDDAHDNTVVVSIRNLDNVNVNVLREIVRELKASEKVEAVTDYEAGRENAVGWMLKVIEDKVVKAPRYIAEKNPLEDVTLAENIPLMRAWEAGRDAGVQNQLNWDGWRSSEPEITNPYAGVATA